MTDIALIWNPASDTADFGLSGFDLATDDGLRTAVIVSLGTDRRALPEDDVPAGDPRGWWGDETGDPIGSRLWVFRRAKATPATQRAIEQAAREALAWMLEDGVASSVDVSSRLGPPGRPADRVELGIVIIRGTPDRRFETAWTVTLAG